eukprot:CAMPEP_0195538336 /NCGR_PEP_ID=MMETSP0794_2-20130614/49475_1 /TAXON_ID=515487 /ORGANISM="Stephanopyxis turris, Strain CCMP 815" /LENGTH=200 /DNA_ID=CAMNT_0040672307 /DNA_START=104 /DNA_END=706 /DNA_ORIENTATION=-
MKISFILFLFFSATADAFVPSVSFNTQRHAKTSLSMTNCIVSRKKFLATSSAALFTAGILPGTAFAYDPKIDDIKLIIGLGLSLDKLADTISNPDTVGVALDQIKTFNKSPNFYVGYAKNFISKSVKNNADGDSRMPLIREASGLISSCQSLLEFREGLTGQEASDEAVRRVKKAQKLIAEFVGKSGVEDERVQKFAASH